jgi:serine/threonine protein kinase
MGQEVLKKFDRYILLDCIAQGGMAEIFRARPASIEASGRLVVVKRILTGYGKNQDFRKMFQSEIKVMLGFNHASIVQLYDFGDSAGQPFIAMEYIDGKNLRQFLSKFQKGEDRFPLELSVYITQEVAGGLHYAHTFKDKITGEPLHIVHRDVSPQNILLSYDGIVKIIDFGIAKARTNVESTRVGIIKGKPSYLSPEQITSGGDQLDGRSDIFSLGTVLWEMLTGKKLFSVRKGENEFAVLKLIESAESFIKPPSTFNPSVPKELDEIVMKSLVKDRTKRYQTGEEFQRALRKFLYSYSPDFSPTDLSEFAKSKFKEEIIDDRKTLQKLSGKVDHMLKNELAAPFVLESSQKKSDPPKPKSKGESTKTGAEGRGSTHTYIDPRKGVAENSASKSYDMQDKVVSSNGRVHEVSNSIDLDPTGAAQRNDRTGARRWGQTHDSIQMPPQQRLRKREAKQVTLVTKFVVGSAAVFAFLIFGGNELGIHHPVLDVVKGYLGLGKVKRDLSSQPSTKPNNTPSDPIQLPSAKVKDINLIVSIDPPGRTENNTTIILKYEGKEESINVTSGMVRVPLDTLLELRVTSEGYRTAVRQFALDSARLKGFTEVYEKVTLEQLKYGFITVISTPSARVTMRNVEDVGRGPSSDIEFYTPESSFKLPVGRYLVTLKNDLLQLERTLTVDIEENRTKKIETNLKME